MTRSTLSHDTTAPTPSKAKGRLGYWLVGGLVLIALALLVPNFATQQNLSNVTVQASGVGLMAIGGAFVLIGGGIDLSSPATMALSAVAGAMVLDWYGPLAGALAMLAVGCIVGIANGFAVARLKMVPLIVTLAMMVTVTGINTSITSGRSFIVPSSLSDVIDGSILGIPVPAMIFIGFTVIGGLIAHRTVVGRWLYMTGVNPEAAFSAGVPVARVLAATYVASGFLAGVAGLVIASRAGAAGVTLGPDVLVLDVVGSAVIGGVSIYGGRGSPVGAALGAVVLAVLANVANLVGIPFYTTLLLKGLVIIAASGVDRFVFVRARDRA
ncbi:MAG: ABC transporter permease [Actinomycetota bacterium]